MEKQNSGLVLQDTKSNLRSCQRAEDFVLTEILNLIVPRKLDWE